MTVTPKEYAFVIAIVAVKVIHSFPFVVIIQPYHLRLTKANPNRKIWENLDVFLITRKVVDKPVDNPSGIFSCKDQAVLKLA
jgi:hypothetical protein